MIELGRGSLAPPRSDGDDTRRASSRTSCRQSRCAEGSILRGWRDARFVDDELLPRWTRDAWFNETGMRPRSGARTTADATKESRRSKAGNGQATTRVLSAVRGHACPAAGVGGAAPARWCGGDRRGAAGQGAGAWASEDRRSTRAAAGDGAWVAARVRAPRRDRRQQREALDARDRRARTGAHGSPLGDAVDALGIVARACRLRLSMTASPWELAVALTGLLHGRPRDPSGF